MIIKLIKQDINFKYQLNYYDKKMTFFSKLFLFLNSPGLLVLMVHRLFYKRQVEEFRIKRAIFFDKIITICLLGVKYFAKIISKSEISNDTYIEGGVCLSDLGHQIIGAKRIGMGTIIHDKVTIGSTPFSSGEKPEIGRNVWIGPGSIIYGSILIGDGATILPGTLLSKSVPSNIVLQGNPPKIIMRDYDNAELRKTSDIAIFNFTSTT